MEAMNKDNNKPAQKKRGRKSKWETHVKPYLDRIPKLKHQGLTDEQISFKLGVAVATFSKYKLQYKELKDVLSTSRMELIEDLEETLYQRALGLCKTTKTKSSTTYDSNGNEVGSYSETTEDQVAPSDRALIFALKNMKSDHWTDVQQVIDNTRDNQTKEVVDAIKSFSDQLMKD